MAGPAIVPENIQALGPIYEAAMLDGMRAYDVADRLLALHEQGMLPIARRGAADALTNTWRRARAGVSKADRRRAAARAFGIPGGADTGVEPNREFNDLWMRFVSSVSALVRQLDVGSVLPDPSHAPVSQAQVRKAARDLAVNLSLHGFGVAHFAATELQTQTTSLIEVLSDPEIRRAYGARDVTQLVDRVVQRELGGVPARGRYLVRAKSGVIILAWL